MRKRRFRLNKVVLPLALIIGLSTGANFMAANAEDVTFTLSSDILTLLDKNKTASLNASGELVDANGKIIGLVTPTAPTVTVLKTKYPQVAVIESDTGLVMAASLYNRIAFLKDLAANETTLGHVSPDKLKVVRDTLEDVRGDLSAKINSGDELTFAEAIDVGQKLDQVAYSLKRADKFRLSVEVARPMVITVPNEPTVKRLTIYKETISPSGDVKSTTTTTTTTTETF